MCQICGCLCLPGAIELDQLVKTLMLIMEDQSAVAIRYSLRGVKQCLPFLLDSSHGSLGLHVLLNLFKVKNNPYWLVKVSRAMPF